METAEKIIESRGIEARFASEGDDRYLNRALPREQARELARALNAAGFEAADVRDNQDPAVSWVYVAETTERTYTYTSAG